MKSITLGLALSVLGGAAMAQTPPAPKPPAPAAQPAPSPAAPPQAQAPGAGGSPAATAQNGPPEGMVVETPNGFFLVRPGEGAPRRLDMPGMGQGSAMGPGGPAMGPGEQPGDEVAEGPDGGMQPPPPRRPPPPRPPESQGARLHIHTPNLDVNVKCPDEEPMKACVDAIAELMDKVGPQGAQTPKP